MSLGQDRGTGPADALSVDPGFILQELVLHAHRFAVMVGDGAVFADAKITLSEWAILRSLKRGERVALSELRRSTGISRQRIGELLTELEKKGLVAITKPANGDRRTRMVSASSKAAGVMSPISHGLQKLANEIGGDKRTKVLRSSARLFERLTKAVKQKPAER